ncbi:hypothetical protein GCM10027343_01730 [Noviherbaspirillum agri]
MRKLQFNWFFSRNRFAAALARCNADAVPRSAKELYAAYRLGLYETVANSECRDGDWRAGFARAVSLATCGRHVEASDIARNLVARRMLGENQVALADALAPFMPAFALSLLDGCGPPAGLRAALLLRMGRSDEATEVLREAIVAGAGIKRPELNLFLSNAEAPVPQQQLAHLNTFFTSYSLSPVALRDPSLPPCPANMVPTIEKGRAMRGPLVTVLMTAFCAGSRIQHAIKSLLDQTYRDIEVIVVDDASSDDTGSVVQAIAVTDARVRYLRLPCNVGTYVAKNIGLQHASGEFITCHDSDDWAHPERIERQVRPLIEDRRVVFSISEWVRVQDDGLYYARPVHPLKRLNPASPLFRKDLVLEKAGGWDPVRTGADSEFLARLKLVFGNKAMHRVALPLTIGSHRPDSLMNAAATGYNPNGISPTRLAYWESWGHFHIDELRAGRKPRLPVDLLGGRRFPAPQSIVVPHQDIETCLNACGALRPNTRAAIRLAPLAA